jgi:hypothetical protein
MFSSVLQRLKAAVHHTTLRVCKESVEDKQIDINRIVVAAISETAWKRFETWAVDLEMFAKYVTVLSKKIQ